MEVLMELKDITKVFVQRKQPQTVLMNLNMSIAKGQSVSIRGKSGCGKSTLLNIIAATQIAESGKMLFNGQDIQILSNKERAIYRSANIGYIPQNLYLLDDRSVFNNIALPLQYLKINKEETRNRVEVLANRLGIGTLLNKNVSLLSGGERQRVAICRAVIKKPLILLADEPTGSLDEENEAIILDVFQELQKEGITIIITTHDEAVSSRCDAMYKLIKGGLISVH
ncbi:MAG: ABC transporter ATP-binding protein [Oscillospiraceae bacterium]|jgi:putative ABC transport system ATP-binding protein|nr:ABC transporter ATP-binding protein [Oscillospiraceae bacterium]